jgi:hypothetical protein
MASLRICMNRVSFIHLADMEWAVQRGAWGANAREWAAFHEGA